MTPEEYARVRDLYLTARELDTAKRNEYLDKACADNPGVRAEVETLLAQTSEAEDQFEIPTEVAGVRAGLERVLDATKPDPVPKQIGRYAILSTLGEGGMGTVYLAEQTEPVRRRVALKLIKLGMDSRQVITRFESERQALALMDHPNIARVLDAGTSEQGRPYFVMEYVPGISITEHCDRHKLSIDERLDLFIQVCQAVQHAHQKGIIHRDIKPSNILVEYTNQTARPKIIDFGVAKATAQRLTERTLFTERGQLIGTPEYMSPEQAEATGQDADTARGYLLPGSAAVRAAYGRAAIRSAHAAPGGFCRDSAHYP